MIKAFDHAFADGKKKLAEAKSLYDKCEFVSAINLLTLVSRLTASACQVLATEAASLLPLWKAEIDRRKNDIVLLEPEAQARLAEFDYKAVLEMIEPIPIALRTESLQGVFQEASDRLQEVAFLKKEIKSAVAEQRFGDALNAIDRLLVVTPWYTKANDIAAKLQEHYIQSATKRIKTYRYHEALKILKKVPDAIRVPKVRDAITFASERAFLLDDIRQSPVVDSTTIAMAERFALLDPDNPEANSLLEKLKNTKPLASDRPFTLPANWAPQSEKSLLGVPVERFTGFQRIDPEAILASPIAARSPDAFFVAAGLALQGLGRSHIDSQFELPKVRSASVTVNALGSLKELAQQLGGRRGFSNKRTHFKTAWGIDLGPGGVRAVKLAVVGTPPKIVVQACDWIEHERILTLRDAESDRLEIISKSLKILKERNNLTADKICLNISGSRVLTRSFDLPLVPLNRIDDAVKYEVAHQFAIPLTELIWDYEILNFVSAKVTGGQMLNGMAQAVKSFHMADWLEPFRTARITPDIVQSDPVALHNFLAYECFERDGPWTALPPENLPASVAVVDIGSDAMNFIVSGPQNTWIRSIPSGGAEVTNRIAKEFRLTFAQAEELKREPAKAESVSKLYDVIEPAMVQIGDEVERSLEAYNRSNPNAPVSRILLVGGGSQLHGLWKYLRRDA